MYSLNKTSTRDFIERKAKSFGFNGTVIAQMRVSALSAVWRRGYDTDYAHCQYDLPKTMVFHKQKSVDM